MQPSKRCTSAETRTTTAEKRAAAAAGAAAGAAGTAKQARTPAAATAKEQAGKATALAELRTILLKLPWRERASYLDKSFASQPGALAALHERFADLTAGPVVGGGCRQSGGCRHRHR